MDDRLARAITECKGVLRHAWYTSDTTATPKVVGEAYIANRCERCGSERLLRVDRLGTAIGSWRYVPPEGYKSITATSMAEWRVQYLNNLRSDKRKQKSA